MDAHGLASRLRWALDVASGWGVKIPRDCRASHALRFLGQLAEANRSEPSKNLYEKTSLSLAIEHHRTAWEVFLITFCGYLAKQPGHPFTKEKIERILRGPAVGEGRDRSTRNTEFELIVASRLFLGGLVVLDGEPDLRFQYGPEVVGVAVKRVTSGAVKQVKNALKSAADQIQRSGLRGHIAINLERRLDNVPVNPDSAEFLEEVDKVFQLIPELDRYFAPYPDVLGVMITSPLTRPKRDRAPNGFPVFDMNLPWRFVRFYFLFEQPFGAAFWTKWQGTLAHNLRFCATSWSPPPT